MDTVMKSCEMCGHPAGSSAEAALLPHVFIRLGESDCDVNEICRVGARRNRRAVLKRICNQDLGRTVVRAWGASRNSYSNECILLFLCEEICSCLVEMCLQYLCSAFITVGSPIVCIHRCNTLQEASWEAIFTCDRLEYANLPSA